MSSVIVGVAECKWSSSPDHTLITYALGSCVAVMIHDPVAMVGGLLHYMLPDSTIDPQKAARNPFMFADTGIPTLFKRAAALGATRRHLVVRVAGGAQVLDEKCFFNIGKRNALALKKALWKVGVVIQGQALGGTKSRTVRMEMSSGQTTWRGPGGEEHDLDSAHRRRGAR